MADMFEATCQEIANLAGQDFPTKWEMTALAKEACSKTGFKYEGGAVMAVKAMISCGFLKGRKDARSWGWITTNKDLAGQASAALGVKINDLTTQLDTANKKLAGIEDEHKKAVEKLASANSILEVRVTTNDTKKPVSYKGVFHHKFPKILALAKARKNIFLYGPTGLGKSHICKQLAEVLGMEFAFIQCTSGMSEGQLGGRLLPVGKQGSFEYVVAEFVRIYENGGVFLLDEIDAADPNVLLLINAALANGKMAVPNRPAKPYAVRHKDFICVAAANTVGFGADRLYSGRNKLDAATLDRFQIGKVCLDYDESVDRVLCPDDALRTRLQRYRKAVLEHKLERAVSTRFMIDAYDMKTHHGFTEADIEEALFSGWKADEVNKVKNYRGAA
jgi:MoxR-like ATPase